MINVYSKGDSIRCSGEFRNTAGELADPATVRFKFTTPAGVTTTYVHGVDAQLVKDATGMYHVDLAGTTATDWYYQMEGTGNGIEMVERHQFAVEPGAF
jgi:hypothetical protein